MSRGLLCKFRFPVVVKGLCRLMGGGGVSAVFPNNMESVMFSCFVRPLCHPTLQVVVLCCLFGILAIVVEGVTLVSKSLFGELSGK